MNSIQIINRFDRKQRKDLGSPDLPKMIYPKRAMIRRHGLLRFGLYIRWRSESGCFWRILYVLL